MPKLHEGHIPVTRENLVPFLTTYGITDFTFEAIPHGIENTSIRIDSGGTKYVLRVYRQGNKAEAEIKFELGFQDYLRSHSIPTAIVVRNAHGDDLTIMDIDGVTWRAILMEFADGTSTTENYTPPVVQELAHLQARMHMLGIEYSRAQDFKKVAWTGLSVDLVRRVDTSTLDAETAAFVGRIKEFSYPLDASLPQGYNHLDLDIGGNIMIQDDRVNAILDFEDVKYSPCVVCLGNTIWDILFSKGEEVMRAYVREYEKVRPLTDAEKKALPYCLSFRNYVIGSVELALNRNVSDLPRILEMEQEIPKISFV